MEAVARVVTRADAEARIRELALNFQEVVHSVRTGNANVAKP